MKIKLLVVTALVVLLASPAQAFRETSIKDMVAQVGMDSQPMLSYIAGFRDAWAWAQTEIINVQGENDAQAEKLWTCATSMSATEILRLSLMTHGDRTTTAAIQATLDQLCWSLVST